MGMNKSHVREAWGEPLHVKSAGEHGEYQKWIYQMPSQGLSERNSQVIYLERGNVVGWETVEDSR